MALQSLLRTRHLLLTGLVFLLFSAGIGGIMASASSGSVPEGTISIGHPSQGDRGVYVQQEFARQGGDWVLSDGSGVPLVFQWGEDTEILDASGARILVNELTILRPDREPRTMFLEPGSRYSIARSDVEVRTYEYEGYDPAGLTAQRSTHAVTHRYFGDWTAPCMMRHSLQGHDQPLAMTWDAHESCHGLLVPRGDTYRYYGSAQLEHGDHEGITAHVWQASGSLPVSAGLPVFDSVQQWFVEGVPYPVRVVGESADSRMVIDLLQLQRGGPVAALHPVELAPAQPWQTTTRLPWGLDDDGVGHPFPLSDAYEAAQREGPASIREWIASHPDAYMAYASNAQFHTEEGDQYRWLFVLTDGQDEQAVDISYRPIRISFGGATPIDVPRYTFGQAEVPYDDMVWAHPDDVPDRLPTVRSLMDEWAQRLDRTPDQADHWSLLIGCMEAPCVAPEVRLSAGTLTYRSNSPLVGSGPAGTISNQWDGESVTWINGIAVSEYQFTTLTSYQDFAFGYPEDPVEAMALATSFQPLGWGAWSAPVRLAAAGSFGVLAAALYWLWPAIKGAAVGGFSRVRTDQLLENPARAAIMEQIESTPGIHYQAIARSHGGGRGTIEHHLRKLGDGGLVTQVKSGGYACYFPRGRVDRSLLAAAGVLRAPAAQRMLAAIAGKPGLTGTEAAGLAGISTSTAHHHLGRLRKAGLVDGSKDGVRLRLQVTATGGSALRLYGERAA